MNQKNKNLTHYILIVFRLLTIFIFGCGIAYAVDPTPTWYVEARCFYKSGVSGAFDEIAVKDPSIVYYNGRYHLFFTGVTNQGWWQTGYASATTIPGLANASHIFLSAIQENYFCAPQVLYFEPQDRWYLVYNSGTYGAAYATTTNIADPNSWNGPQNLGLPDPVGYDYFIICDDSYAYIFYSESGEARKVIWRRTPLSSFPSGWSSHQTAVTTTFEGVAVYKCLADSRYYLLCEDYDDNKYYGLWTSSNLTGPWTQVAQKWASRQNLSFVADHWTDNVSHGEILRSGYNQKLEINDIDRADFLIQGVVNGSYGEYWQIPWDIGIIRNYSGGSQVTPDPIETPVPTPTLIPTPTPGSGDGLIGQYYNNMDFTSLVMTRVDQTIDFNWGEGSPDSSIDSDTYSIRWTGKLVPHFSENYTFYANTDDGVRLRVNNQLIIDNWVDQAATEVSGNINLNAGIQYDIEMEYYENGGGAVAQLSWSSNNQPKEIIPRSQLFSGGGVTEDLGDVNSDGQVDIVDALLVAQFYVGLNPANFVQANADVNCDNSMDIVDALLIAQYYVGLIVDISC